MSIATSFAAMISADNVKRKAELIARGIKTIDPKEGCQIRKRLREMGMDALNRYRDGILTGAEYEVNFRNVNAAIMHTLRREELFCLS